MVAELEGLIGAPGDVEVVDADAIDVTLPGEL